MRTENKNVDLFLSNEATFADFRLKVFTPTFYH